MRLPGAVGTMTSLVAGALLATGCTMCPDPFDYSGPVPNGSAPQNDFAARSNGILPLRSRPLPWPAVVDDGTPSDTDPNTVADRPGTDGATTDDAPGSTPVERVATEEAESVTR